VMPAEGLYVDGVGGGVMMTRCDGILMVGRAGIVMVGYAGVVMVGCAGVLLSQRSNDRELRGDML
jgi:hypothetical protein